MMTAKTIIFLRLLDQTEIPASFQSAFDVVYFRMEERLSYSSAEKDMVLLHHEVEIECLDSKITEKHRSTLLEFGKTLDGKTTTAMALTVGILAAVGALVLSVILLSVLYSKQINSVSELLISVSAALTDKQNCSFHLSHLLPLKGGTLLLSPFFIMHPYPKKCDNTFNHMVLLNRITILTDNFAGIQ